MSLHVETVCVSGPSSLEYHSIFNCLPASLFGYILEKQRHHFSTKAKLFLLPHL